MPSLSQTRRSPTWLPLAAALSSALEHSRSGDMFIGEPFSRADEKAVGFTVSRWMTDGDARFAGVAVMGVRLAYFRQLLAQFAGAGRSVVLLRRDGTVIMRLPFRLNDVGNRLEPQTPFDIALRTGATAAATWDATDRVERRFAFQPAGAFPLVVGIGTPIASLSANPALWLLLTAVCSAPLASAPLVSRQWRARRRACAPVPEQ